MRIIFTLLVTICFSLPLFAQKYSNAVEYMSVFSAESKRISTDMWDYTRAVAHGKSARKVAKRRSELIATVSEARRKAAGMPGFENDKSLRDSLVSYLKLAHLVLTEDYGKIMDLEEIAEQSYDHMEAYLLAQEKADEKLDAATERINATERAFAASHNVNLIEGEKDKLSKNLAKAGTVMKYYNTVNLIFFKAYKQELYMSDAMRKNDINGVEQNRNSLISISDANLQKLDTMKAYMGDMSLKLACKELLAFYKKEASEKIPQLADFFLKKENFEKVKKAFEAKSEKSRTQADVDAFNKAVNEYNAASNKYNTIVGELDKTRATLINKWNETGTKFLDKHIAKK